MSRRRDQDDGLDRAFVRRVLFAFGVGASLFLIWKLSGMLLLLFGSIILAVLLRAIADPIAERTPLRQGPAVALAVLLLVAILAGSGWMFGATVSAQTQQLLANIPRSAAELQTLLADLPFSEQLNRAFQDVPALLAGAQGIAGRVGGAAIGLIGGLTSLVLVLVAGVFLAADPAGHRDGLLMLLPRDMRPSVRDAANTTGHALKAWLLGQLADMVLVGVMTGVGMWALGLPSPAALGLFAGLTTFVPIIGPIVGAVPGILLAVQGGWELVLWTTLAYIVIQQVEGNLLYPFIQKRAVDLPPVLTLFGVIALGMLFGVTGVLVAAPMMVVLYVATKVLYLRNTLGEDVNVRGARK